MALPGSVQTEVLMPQPRMSAPWNTPRERTKMNRPSHKRQPVLTHSFRFFLHRSLVPLSSIEHFYIKNPMLHFRIAAADLPSLSPPVIGMDSALFAKLYH